MTAMSLMKLAMFIIDPIPNLSDAFPKSSVINITSVFLQLSRTLYGTQTLSRINLTASAVCIVLDRKVIEVTLSPYGSLCLLHDLICLVAA